jgi:hypothetical protein
MPRVEGKVPTDVDQGPERHVLVGQFKSDEAYEPVVLCSFYGPLPEAVLFEAGFEAIDEVVTLLPSQCPVAVPHHLPVGVDLSKRLPVLVGPPA